LHGIDIHDLGVTKVEAPHRSRPVEAVR
jgi:hypothetical protein